MASSCPIRGVVFDMDGTLTLPGSIDFAAMRARISAPHGVDVLDHIEAHDDIRERARLHSIIEDEEEVGFHRQQLMPDATVLLDALTSYSLHLAVVTRNNEGVMKRTLALFERPSAFSVTLSRSFSPGKPHPAPIHHICSVWSCNPQNVVMVGDSRDDILCGLAAGARTILVGSPGQFGYDDALPLADASVQNLSSIISVLQSWNSSLSTGAKGNV